MMLLLAISCKSSNVTEEEGTAYGHAR